MTSTIVRIDAATLTGRRSRAAGSNARLGYHGSEAHLPLVRLTTSEGATGFGRCAVREEDLRPLLGQPVVELVIDATVVPDWVRVEFPLLDLAARIAGLPVHAFAGSGIDGSHRIRAYDTSLYFDDLDIADDGAAADLIAGEAREGWDLGHRAFKIKVGRGAMHMPLEEGTQRDIAVINAVRTAVGPDAPVMIDANNGWNLNLVKQVLSATRDANLYWIEEPFHEDNVLFAHLQRWLVESDLPVLIADGEGVPHPSVAAWAHEGLIDVVQHNIHGYGFGAWQRLGRELDAAGRHSSPHTYGNGIGNYVTCQLSALVNGLEYVEWDAATFSEIDASGYELADGWVTVPSTPGFGLELDTGAFEAAVAEAGFRLTA